jgi:hypothetical protein
MTREEQIKKGESFPPVSPQKPDAGFIARYEQGKDALREIVLEVKAADRRVKDKIFRAGVMIPTAAVIREKIKEFCAIPYRRADGSLAPCEGVTEGWKGCPPHSTPIAETVSLLRSASVFLILQFSGLTHHAFQKHVHEFTLSVESALREKGRRVLGSYSTGPCRLCPRGCSVNGECRQPERRRFALEYCGFWVKSLCRRASHFPLCGDGDWEIEWIKDWNLPAQSPLTYRSVTGILLG